LKVLPGDVKNEPRQALCGGEDGLDFYKKIIRGCLSYLDKKGFIFFEIDASAAKGIRRLLSENFLTQEVIKDYNNRDRVIFAQRR
jgi:release factor glutamine methyltransferase